MLSVAMAQLSLYRRGRWIIVAFLRIRKSETILKVSSASVADRNLSSEKSQVNSLLAKHLGQSFPESGPSFSNVMAEAVGYAILAMKKWPYVIDWCDYLQSL